MVSMWIRQPVLILKTTWCTKFHSFKKKPFKIYVSLLEARFYLMNFWIQISWLSSQRGVASKGKWCSGKVYLLQRKNSGRMFRYQFCFCHEDLYLILDMLLSLSSLQVCWGKSELTDIFKLFDCRYDFLLKNNLKNSFSVFSALLPVSSGYPLSTRDSKPNSWLFFFFLVCCFVFI